MSDAARAIGPEQANKQTNKQANKQTNKLIHNNNKSGDQQ